MFYLTFNPLTGEIKIFFKFYEIWFQSVFWDSSWMRILEKNLEIEKEDKKFEKLINMVYLYEFYYCGD